MSQSTDHLASNIDATATNAASQIEAQDRASFLRSKLKTTLALLLVVPVLAIMLHIVRWLAGYPAWSTLWLLVVIPLTIAVPALWLFFQVKSRQSEISRRRALLAVDQQLNSSDRISTADQFLQEINRDGFMQAAVQDASDWAQKGRETSLAQSAIPKAPFQSWLAIPLSVLALALAGFLATFSRSTPEGQGVPAGQSLAANVSVQSKPATRNSTPKQNDELPQTERPEAPRDRRSQQSVNRQGSANTAIPENAEESQGKLNEGETRESQQSANPSSARGAPSASGQPSKSGDKQKPKAKKKQKKKPEVERPKKERKQDDKPSGATAGQGSSKGSDNNAAPSDWASTSQAATPDDEDTEDEDEVDDEEEEQESRGGVQPNMRDRRTPVNRDLQIGFGTNRPNPDANGRGGPGGQKKSRGVASLVLGVPIPDRVNGQPNKGRMRITQQRITPEAEQNDPVVAEKRSARDGAVGPIHHPDLSPWLRDIVERYFMQRRGMHPLKTAPTNSTSLNSTTIDPLKATGVAESSPQS